MMFVIKLAGIVIFLLFMVLFVVGAMAEDCTHSDSLRQFLASQGMRRNANAMSPRRIMSGKSRLYSRPTLRRT